MTVNANTLPAWRSDPAGPARGAVIVVHEIFGLTPHIKSLCVRLAGDGYIAVAPDLFAGQFDGEFLPYTPDGKQTGIAVKNQLGEEAMAAQLALWVEQLATENNVAVIGFCLGGTLAWLCSALPGVSCAVAYYGVGLGRHLGVHPRAPVLMHFGRRDPSIPAAEIAALRDAYPALEIHEYDAGHAFNRDDDVNYQEASAKPAWQRTMAFLDQHLGEKS